MKQFVFKISAFFLLYGLIIGGLGLVVPTTPRSKKSLLFAKLQKDRLLEQTPAPRLIFVGGSNLSFGLDSKMIKDALKVNPINTGVHATIGLLYMMSNTESRIKSGDVVVLIPEYSHYYGRSAFGGEELLRTVVDVDPKSWTSLGRDQSINALEYFSKYTFSKLRRGEYRNIVESDIYGVSSFNEYGDAVGHWEKSPQKVNPFPRIREKMNSYVFDAMESFRKKVEGKGASLIVSFPGFQDVSFDHSKEEIMRAKEELERRNFKLVGSPERYRMRPEYMFNTPYHLSRAGVIARTRLVIEDLRSILNRKD